MLQQLLGLEAAVPVPRWTGGERLDPIEALRDARVVEIEQDALPENVGDGYSRSPGGGWLSRLWRWANSRLDRVHAQPRPLVRVEIASKFRFPHASYNMHS